MKGGESRRDTGTNPPLANHISQPDQASTTRVKDKSKHVIDLTDDPFASVDLVRSQNHKRNEHNVATAKSNFQQRVDTSFNSTSAINTLLAVSARNNSKRLVAGATTDGKNVGTDFPGKREQAILKLYDTFRFHSCRFTFR